MIERLKQLQANKVQFTAGGKLYDACKSDDNLRRDIEVLAKHYLHRSVSGCQNCYMDAYIQLATLNLEKVMNTENCDYKLRNGALLRDRINQDVSLNCTNNNISNELALYHLKTNPGCVKYFEKFPKDFEKQVEAYKLPGEQTDDLTAQEQAALAQTESEVKFVELIAQALKDKVTKTAIKEQHKSTELVGTKKLTQRFMAELIERADTLILNAEPHAEPTTDLNAEPKAEQTTDLTAEEQFKESVKEEESTDENPNAENNPE